MTLNLILVPKYKETILVLKYKENLRNYLYYAKSDDLIDNFKHEVVLFYSTVSNKRGGLQISDKIRVKLG